MKRLIVEFTRSTDGRSCDSIYLPIPPDVSEYDFYLLLEALEHSDKVRSWDILSSNMLKDKTAKPLFTKGPST